MRLNNEQIARLIRHACDKNGNAELSDTPFYFIGVDKSEPFVVECNYNGFGYRPSIKFYNSFDKLTENKQIATVLRAACTAIEQYREKELNDRPKKNLAARLYTKALKRVEVAEEATV